MELEQRFSSDEACRQYLFDLRWPSGFSCPRCGHHEAWHMSRHLYLCASCRFQVSVTAGTIFQDTRKPLTLWFRAIWGVTSQKLGMSALGLKRELGLGSYRTAWTWLHKLRRVMGETRQRSTLRHGGSGCDLRRRRKEGKKEGQRRRWQNLSACGCSGRRQADRPDSVSPTTGRIFRQSCSSH